MNNKITLPRAELSIEEILPLNRGGTNADNFIEAAENLGLLTERNKSTTNGLLELDVNGIINPKYLPGSAPSSVMISGPTFLQAGEVGTYTITNYNDYGSYIPSTLDGNYSRVGDTITYTAPLTLGLSGFLINDVLFSINIIQPIPVKPTIVSPTAGSTNIAIVIDATTSAFAVPNGSDTHEASDWQIATDLAFTAIVDSSMADTVNKTSYTNTVDLAYTTVYYMRVRHKGVSYGYSEWSNVVSFTTRAVSTPTAESAKVISTSPGSLDSFANHSVAMNYGGIRIVAGCPFSDPDGVSNSGAAFVFLRVGKTWTLEAKITSSVKSSSSWYGKIVSITNDSTRIAISAHQDDPAGVLNAGAVYIYKRNGTTWTEEAIITASDKVTNDQFGSHLAITGDGTRVIIGSSSADVGGVTNCGAVYVFTRSGTTWTEEAKLTASDKADNTLLGSKIAVDNNGTRFIASSETADAGGIVDSGAVYVFLRTGTTWAQEAILSASDKSANKKFGNSLAINSGGTRVAVGCILSDVSGVTNTGAVYIFIRSGTVWSQEQIIGAPDTLADGDRFGYSVSFTYDAGKIFIGASNKTGNGVANSGIVYIFNRSGVNWTFLNSLTHNDGVSGDNFGSSLSASGDGYWVFVGAGTKLTSGFSSAGAGYIFN